MWALIRAIHRAAHLTIAVSPKAAADLVEAGACDPKTVKVGGTQGGGAFRVRGFPSTGARFCCACQV